MEKELPEDIETWQAFRTAYAAKKKASITEVAEAWKRYKELYPEKKWSTKSSQKRSASKKSPKTSSKKTSQKKSRVITKKKSPTKKQGSKEDVAAVTSSAPSAAPSASSAAPTRLQYASLTGLPTDIGEVLLKGADVATIRAMRIASKGTSRLTSRVMQQLCSMLPSRKEIRDYIESLEGDFSISYLKWLPNSMLIASESIVRERNNVRILEGLSDIRMSYSRSLVGALRYMFEFMVDNELYDIFVAPWVVKEILKRRGGCKDVNIDKIIRDYIYLIYSRYTQPYIGDKRLEDVDLKNIQLPAMVTSDEKKRIWIIQHWLVHSTERWYIPTSKEAEAKNKKVTFNDYYAHLVLANRDDLRTALMALQGTIKKLF